MIDLTSNRISHAMSVEEFASTKALIQKVSEALSFLVKLGKEDVDLMYNMSDADKTFVRNCLVEMNNATDIIPGYLKAEEISTDLTCGEQLLEIENTMSEMVANIRRNRMLANYEAFSGASVFYRIVGAASRSGSAPAKAMYERLKSYHVNRNKGGRSSKSKNTGDSSLK